MPPRSLHLHRHNHEPVLVSGHQPYLCPLRKWQTTTHPNNLSTTAPKQQLGGSTDLFDGAYNCTASGKAGNETNIIQLNVDNTLNTACVSQLPIYRACWQSCPDEAQQFNGGTCPFGYWDSCGPPAGSIIRPNEYQPPAAIQSNDPAIPSPQATPNPANNPPPNPRLPSSFNDR